MQKQHQNVATILSLSVIALSIVALAFPTRTESLPTPEPTYESIPLLVIEVATTTVPLKKAVEEKPQLNPTLKRICSCESNGNPNGEPRQFNSDGSVVTGKINPLDTGMCQINLKYHQATADRLGHDLFTATGNAAYATWLFETQGTTPWNWSKSCWQ